jgi:AraC-like DNA-binding protein
VNQAKQIAELAALDMKPGDIAQAVGVSKATVYRKLKHRTGSTQVVAGSA